MVSVADVRRHNRIPDYENDTEVLRCLLAAQSRARAAGVPEFEHNALYDQFLLDLAGYQYDNRGMAADELETAEDMIRSYVLQLRYAEEDDA